VESAPGRGSTFWFVVPLPARPSVEPAACGSSAELSSKRVLIVEPHAIGRKVLEQYLAGWGIEHESVDSASSALSLLGAGRAFDLIVTDLRMECMDGLQLGRTIAADVTLEAKPKLVLLASATQRGDADQALAAGFSGYLPKPIWPQQLLQLLCRLFGPAEHEQRRLVTRHEISAGRVKARRPILVVEDNKVNQRVVVRMLDKLGYRADVAADGARGLDAVRRAQYAAVLMDCQMPVMDGFAATAAIRALSTEKARVPIIALTAHAAAADREQCLAAGMDDYLSKPLELSALSAVLSRWLDGPSKTSPPSATRPARSQTSVGVDPVVRRPFGL